jgi:acetylornithine deacetylase/succinyl-diaminopimelate desuccinylase family protein
MSEIDEQLPSFPDLIVCPVGCGSFAQAVVRHSKQPGRKTRVLTVEPDGAPCLWKSLQNSENRPSGTHKTIMAGMSCGGVSSLAWPILKAGVDASLTISDAESHAAVEKLREFGINAGPCGGATLAAYQRLDESAKKGLGLTEDSVVVLLCTEGARDYARPLNVSSDDPIILSQQLIRIDSSNPNLSRAGGAGEGAIANYITAWLDHRDIESHRLENTAGRPSIVGIVRGRGGGKSLMLNGHIDTVTTIGYKGDPFNPEIHDGSIYGRGAFDMKCGIASALVTLVRCQAAHLSGDVLVAAVADEEHLSMGTTEILEAGWTADGAVVCEPTQQFVTLDHNGFVWIEVDILGKAAHGSRYDLGVDAISKAGHFLAKIDRYAQELLKRTPTSECGTGSLHASLIQGGEEISSYPAKCTIGIERRTVPGETPEAIEAEFQEILDHIKDTVEDFKYNFRVTMSRPPFHVDQENCFVKSALTSIRKSLNKPVEIKAERAWTDCALLSEKGIPALLFGCDGGGAHAATEWATIKSVYEVTDATTRIAMDFCK